jgi:hypothetical protein
MAYWLLATPRTPCHWQAPCEGLVFDNTIGSKNEVDQETALRQLRDASNGLHEPE